ncbi:hypothetical protein AVEN_109102-1 [Araneus ventricosus]|uniref:DUF4817 domain-containing protein n=1 Tax=Araneus ventricosus TaxID=182803 RepID=A0A4Y2NQ40_ARAVE|nr:hypothetical protein AVEN_109102-1 [Araneus ventricosus]
MCRHRTLNLLQQKIPNASVMMATVQQKAHFASLWFHHSKSIVRVKRCFHLEYRNCQSSSKNSKRCRKGAGRPLVSDKFVEQVKETFTP